MWCHCDIKLPWQQWGRPLIFPPSALTTPICSPFHAMLQHRQHKKLLAERRQSECTRLQAALKREPLSNGWGRERNRGWRPPVCVPLATKHPSWQTAESLLRLKAFNNRLDEEKGDLLYVARCRWEGETMTLQFWPKRQAKSFLWGIYLHQTEKGDS